MLGAVGSVRGADDVYPSRPITIVVPSAAGNVNDAVARLVGAELTQKWGQPVIVLNKPGAGTEIGTRYVANADKDGYTALLTYTAHVQNPALYKNLSYDPITDFAPVSQVAYSSTILAVYPGFEAQTFSGLVALVKENPGQYFYGSYGAGTTGHILGELLKQEAGLKMDHVAYKGGAPLATDMIAGHVKFGFIAVGTAMPYIKAGTLKPLAITGSARSPLLPDVPTFLEAGYNGFEPDAWMGLLFPAGVPAQRVETLSRAVAEIVGQPAMQQRFGELNLVAIGNTPGQFAAVLSADLAKWAAVIKQVGLDRNP
ncbi:tripartite tricarboxylate transporter substrate binding protein [Bordetella petrii]|nr:tripartite tricarboxylate transporter substrate binding protein [Bordetella petrii]